VSTPRRLFKVGCWTASPAASRSVGLTEPRRNGGSMEGKSSSPQTGILSSFLSTRHLKYLAQLRLWAVYSDRHPRRSLKWETRRSLQDRGVAGRALSSGGDLDETYPCVTCCRSGTEPSLSRGAGTCSRSSGHRAAQPVLSGPRTEHSRPLCEQPRFPVQRARHQQCQRWHRRTALLGRLSIRRRLLPAVATLGNGCTGLRARQTDDVRLNTWVLSRGIFGPLFDPPWATGPGSVT
jgi:hypothetical protein